MRVVPAATNDPSLHSQLAAIMETMARTALSQISKLVDEDSVKLRFDLSEALFANSALSEKVKKLECALASRGSSRNVGVQTEDSKDWCTNQGKDEDPLHPVTDLPHPSEKSTDTFCDPVTETEDSYEDSVLNTAIKSQQELIGTEEHGESAPIESEQLQLFSFSANDGDCGPSFDENQSMGLIHCYPDEAFSSHVIPIDEDYDDDEDDDDVQFVDESQEDFSTNFAPVGPIISEWQTMVPHQNNMGTTKDNGMGHNPDMPNIATDRTLHKVRFPCKICRRTFFYKRTLTRHMKSHNSNFCEICKQHFPKRTKFKPHVCVPQLPDKSLVRACEICGKLCPNPSSLRLHNLVHTGEKPHQCAFCGQTFTQKGNLKCHLRIHTGERPFHCNLCGKSFIQKINLTCHMMSHAREIKAKK